MKWEKKSWKRGNNRKKGNILWGLFEIVFEKLVVKSAKEKYIYKIDSLNFVHFFLFMFYFPFFITFYNHKCVDGTLIPCFGLTGPHSGSDATSLIGSYGIVEERDGELGIRATFKKRYITLAPVAGCVGIGLNLQDPNGLLKGKGGEGFTVALLE